MRRLMQRLLVVVPLVVLGGCKRGGASTEHAAEVALAEVTPDELARRIEQRQPVAVYDVNNRARYERGHVPGARWATFNDVKPGDLPGDKGTPLVFYCANEH